MIAAGLGLSVTAEGVETPEQQEMLRAFGVHHMQGFLFCKPVSADELASGLETNPDVWTRKASKG